MMLLGANETSPWESFFKNIPAIIEQAAKSPLGIIAVMIVALSVIAICFFRRSGDRIRLVVFLVLFVGFGAFLAAIAMVPSLQPQTIRKEEIVNIPPPIHVLGIQHKARPDGSYFDFDRAELDAILNSRNWNNQVVYISKSREGPYMPAVVWSVSNGGPGTAHGRYVPDGRPGDWKAGDLIYVAPKLGGTWHADK